MKEFINENQKLVKILLIMIILIIILSILINIFNKKNNLLINSYVTKLENKDVNLENDACDIDKVLKYNNIPYFILNNDLYNKLNQEILTDFLLRACYQNGEIDYEASLYDDILSLAINISYDTTDDLTYLEYKTYNINTKNNEKMTNQDILDKYNLTKDIVEEKVFTKLREYYNYEKEKNYLTDESFNDYLNILEYKPITLNNMNLYIDSKKDLYIYKDYTLSEGMSIDENFPYITIKFKLN